MKYRHITLLLAISLALFAQAQKTNSFYEHYTGLISEPLQITADLIRSEESFSGFYYYKFKDGEKWIISKPIALDGHVEKDSTFVLNEFGGGTSFFKGKLSTPKLFSGEWINQLLKEPVDFTLKATYAQGTIPLQVVEWRQQAFFNNDKQMPHADFHVTLLFPNQQVDAAILHQLTNRIHYYIGYRESGDNQQNIMKSISDTYFSQFQSALENIQLDSFPRSFHWEKSIRMDVINNEKGLLCLQFDTYAKSGDQEGSSVRKFLIFHLAKNQVLKLNDLVAEDKKPQLAEKLTQKLRQQYRIADNVSLQQSGFFEETISPSANFYLHRGGIGFYYNVYEIAPFSNGPTEIFLSWDELQPFLLTDHPLQGFFNP